MTRKETPIGVLQRIWLLSKKKNQKTKNNLYEDYHSKGIINVC